jgi:heterodisulfide reductase subunit C
MARVQTLPQTAAPVRVVREGGSDRSLALEIMERTGEDINRCYHCGSCANGCPFVQALDYTPNQVLRLVQFGLRPQVLGCSTIWVCVGCNTCSSQCPMAIDMGAVMDTLRHLAVEEGVAVAEPDILGFHQEMLRSLKRYGRAHKLGIMWRYKLRTRSFLKDMDVGLKMLVKRKLELTPSRVRNLKEILPIIKEFTGEMK